jgi:hypothetical protein
MRWRSRRQIAPHTSASARSPFGATAGFAEVVDGRLGVDIHAFSMNRRGTSPEDTAEGSRHDRFMAPGTRPTSGGANFVAPRNAGPGSARVRTQTQEPGRRCCSLAHSRSIKYVSVNHRSLCDTAWSMIASSSRSAIDGEQGSMRSQSPREIGCGIAGGDDLDERIYDARIELMPSVGNQLGPGHVE